MLFRETVALVIGIAFIVFVFIVFPMNNERREATARHHKELIEAVERMTAACEVSHE